jgi:hypothetical protein
MVIEKVAAVGAGISAAAMTLAQTVPDPEGLMGAAGKLTATAFLGLTCLGCLFLIYRGVTADAEQDIHVAKASLKQAEALRDVAEALGKQATGLQDVAREVRRAVDQTSERRDR